MSNKTYLVTGAAGFIGAAVSEKLVSEGHRVVTIDNLSTGYRDHVPQGVDFIEGDCADPKIIEKLSAYKLDAIFHIAGQSSGEISFENPAYDLQSNTLSTVLLLKYARANGIKKFIYASTMSIYGIQPDAPVDETAVVNPVSFYAVGKMASEKYMDIYSKFGMVNTALRLFNVYGPGQNMKNLKQGMLSIYLAQALENKKVVVKGSPDRFRDFVYIDDVVQSFLAALKIEEPGFRFYNVATGVRTTVKILLEKIQHHLADRFPVQYSDSTPGDQFGIFGNANKLKSEFGTIIKTDIDTGLARMIGWLKTTNA